MTLEWASLLSAFFLALVHSQGGRIASWQERPRSPWLSFGGGVAVAYVFVHLLPELSELQHSVQESRGKSGWYWQHHLYLVGLLGLVIFYAVERAAKTTRHVRNGEDEERAAGWVFWAHLAALVFYTAFIGYFVIERATEGVWKLLVFTSVFALHFLANDRALRQDYKTLYHRIGRWVLAAAVLAGWIAGKLWHIPELPYSLVLGFLAGGVTFNAIKEELPKERESRFWPFFLGAVACAFLLVTTHR